MKLVIDGFGKSIRKRDNQIVIKENNDEVDFFLAKDLEQILILGKGSITFDALDLLAKYHVDCLSVNWKGEVKYRLSFSEHKNVQIRKEQYFALKDKRSGYLAKSFIRGKIENQKATLGTLAKSRDEEIILIQRDKLADLLLKLDKVKNLPIHMVQSNILGIEGQASVEYWKGFKLAIKNNIGFESRSGRYARDGVNVMLNYSYAILQSEVLKALNLVGLDVYAGFLHSDRYGRASLVFDLIEEFRQQIVDKTVLSLINKNQISINDFTENKNKLFISENGRKLLISNILDKLDNEINYNGSKISYCEIIKNQAKAIVDYLVKNKKYDPFYLRW